MATNDCTVTDHSDPTGKRAQLAHGKRQEIAVQAAYQLEAIFACIIESCAQLRKEVPGPSFDRELLPDVIRALAVRGLALSGFAMSAIGDADASVDDLMRQVTHG
jgi:hypothetical protein